MKTIQIPLELAEELMRCLYNKAAQNWLEFGTMSNKQEDFLPDSYHKLKKLVEERELPPPICMYCKDYESVERLSGYKTYKGKYSAFVQSTNSYYTYQDGEWLLDTELMEQHNLT